MFTRVRILKVIGVQKIFFTYSREYFKFAPQAVLRIVLFVPVNLAGQRSAGEASPFTGTVFER